MSRPFRSLAAGLATALAGGVLVTAPSPAHAVDATKTFDYICNGTLSIPTPSLPLSPVPGVPIPVVVPPVAVPMTLTVPTGLDQLAPGAAVPATPLSGSLGLSSVLGLVSSLLTSVEGTVGGLGLPIGDTGRSLTAQLSSAPTTLSGLLGSLGGSLPLTGQLPAFTAPTTAGGYDLTLPDGFTLSLAGVPTALGTQESLGALTCTLAGTMTSVTRILTRVVVVLPGGTVPGGVGTGPGPVVPAGAHVDTSAANPCVATPAARAGQRRTLLRAHAARVSWKRHPKIAVALRVRQRAVHGPLVVARGRVIACYGALQVGRKKLGDGRATLRTMRFYPGRYRVRLVYLGSRQARPVARTITLRIKR